MNKIDKPVMRDDRGRWLPGSGSPSPGRPVSSRQKISEKLLLDLSEVWESHGKTVLERLAATEPKALAQIAYGILPKDLLIGIEHRLPMNISPEDWEGLLRVAATLKEIAPAASPEEIDQALRAGFSRSVLQIEQNPA
ncbi:hypothetical protein [Bradyrhizobium japonicum]|uniref:hypothetical protein n=1 Tax=Bradyrhizobium japonicum TaxID=375 RepID=UPI00339A78B7